MKKTLLLSFALLGLASFSHAQLIELSSGHIDLGLGYENGDWDPHIHLHGGGEFEPDEAYLYYGIAARANRPAGSAYDFIGVSAGSQIWRNYSNNVTGIPWLGFGFEEIAPGTFDSSVQSDPRLDPVSAEWVDVNLISFTGPGQVSFFQGGGASPKVWFATSDGIDTTDKFISTVGGHEHGSFVFTQTGIYTLTFQASALLNGTRVFSDEYTYSFGVEQAVPEPMTMGLLALGAAALAKRRKSAKK
ncbi:MAG: choice-of-anchor M domain-containing protein [Fimbriimonadaceae bacterium]|jgi:surface-anchored protein|nr:choice-of-anchor M domain-containing protein [Fimbriimonadaceae bacterium]